jgi:hypothetical protein
VRLRKRATCVRRSSRVSALALGRNYLANARAFLATSA